METPNLQNVAEPALGQRVHAVLTARIVSMAFRRVLVQVGPPKTAGVPLGFPLLFLLVFLLPFLVHETKTGGCFLGFPWMAP